MPRFMVERNFAERLEMTKEGTDRVNLINDEEGVEMDIDFPERRQAQDLSLRERRGDQNGSTTE